METDFIVSMFIVIPIWILIFIILIVWWKGDDR